MDIKQAVKKQANNVKEMDQQGKINTLYMSIALGILISVISLGAFQLVLPAVFGVTFTGIAAAASSRLAAVGGVVGTVTGAIGEGIGNYSTYIVQPALAGNPIAIFAFVSTMIFATVIAVNVFAHDQVWR